MTTISKKRCYISAVLVFLAGIFADQFTKYMAAGSLKDQPPVVLIKNVFELQYLENRGAAFGMLQDQKLFFILVGVFMLLVGTFFFVKMPFEKHFSPLRWCLVLIMTGAVGNMIDRICYNYVIDFFYFSLIDFPIFNVADIFVTVATIVLLLLILFYYTEEDLDLLTGLLPHRKKGQVNE